MQNRAQNFHLFLWEETFHITKHISCHKPIHKRLPSCVSLLFCLVCLFVCVCIWVSMCECMCVHACGRERESEFLFSRAMCDKREASCLKWIHLITHDTLFVPLSHEVHKVKRMPQMLVEEGLNCFWKFYIFSKRACFLMHFNYNIKPIIKLY